MKINKIVIASPMYREIQHLIEAKGLEKDVHYYSDDAVTQDDLEGADAFVSFNMKADLDYQNLKWVHSLGAGVDRFLFNSHWPKDVLLTRTICFFGQRIAEYCLSYLLKDLQLHDQFETLKDQKQWQPITPKLLNEHKVMIYGTGAIGQTVAKVLSLFGVEVYGVSLGGKQKAHFHKVMTLESHYEKLNEMNFLINTLPLTEQTVRLFDEKIFNSLNRGAFINVGRGATLNEQSLLDALQSGHVKFAVLDVFAKEPLPVDHELWNHPKVLITPHISAVTTPSEGIDCFLDTLKRIEGNKPLHNIVDIEKGY